MMNYNILRLNGYKNNIIIRYIIMTSTDDKKVAKTKQLKKVEEALDRVNKNTLDYVIQLATGMSNMDIVQSFNQEVYDFFAVLINITKRLKVDREYKIEAYNSFFETAVKTNVMLPIEGFSLRILEYAPEIYSENEECFLNMEIPDGKVQAGDEFNIIRSAEFKLLWKKLNQEDKNVLKEKILLLTTYAHVHFYQSILAVNRQ
jgi:hypothetical protein